MTNYTKCCYFACISSAKYGYPGEIPIYCSRHQLCDMKELSCINLHGDSNNLEIRETTVDKNSSNQKINSPIRLRSAPGRLGTAARPFRVRDESPEITGEDFDKSDTEKSESSRNESEFNLEVNEDELLIESNKNPGETCAKIQEASRCHKCEKIALYGHPGGNASSCYFHRDDCMVRICEVKDFCCVESNCHDCPRYNYPLKLYPLYCQRHKLIGMDDVGCQIDGCPLVATYSYFSENVKMFCYIHRKNGMILKKKQGICFHSGCEISASYNFLDRKKTIYCSKHKLPNMVNVRIKRCIYPSCTKQAGYNYYFETERAYCYMHRMKGMVNIVKPSCPFPGCYQVSKYNYSSEIRGLYCYKHKLENMVLINRPKRAPATNSDVSSKKQRVLNDDSADDDVDISKINSEI